MKQAYNVLTGLADDTGALENILKTKHSVHALPRLIADWNINRYGAPTATNTPDEQDEGFDLEYFPIESICEPYRPTKGINKAILGQMAAATEMNRQGLPRYYTASPDDEYKYWLAPFPTDDNGDMPLHTDGITTARPQVVYDQPYKGNKIVINIENTWASPTNHEVFIMVDEDTTWQSIAINPEVNANGQIILYYDGTGWTTDRFNTYGENQKLVSNVEDPKNMTFKIKGIQYRVNALGNGRRPKTQWDDESIETEFNTQEWITRFYKFSAGTNQRAYVASQGKNSLLPIIAIELHREEDMTHRLISVNDTFDISDSDELYPMGTITSNVSSISLDNAVPSTDPSKFTGAPGSEYEGIMEGNIQFNLEYIYEGGWAVQQFRMYSGYPAGKNSDVLELDLEDSSKFLKNIDAPVVMYEKMPVTEIIWRVLDSVGFNSYYVDESDLANDHIIPIYYTNPEETVWEVLDSISNQTQTAIYFDEHDTLQVRTRSAAMDIAKQVTDWDVHGRTSGTTLADIIDIDAQDSIENNIVNVTYSTTTWAEDRYGEATNEVVWEAEGDVLRSSPLTKSMTTSSTVIRMSQKEGSTWPYSGFANIEGEIIAYDGKQYIYHTGLNGNKQNRVWVKNNDERLKYDKKSKAQYRSRNRFTGNLKVTERGAWNTVPARHDVDIFNYNKKMFRDDAGNAVVRRAWKKGINHNKGLSAVTINSPKGMKTTRHTLMCGVGGINTSNAKYFGTELTFLGRNSKKHQRAGIFLNNQGPKEDGYYIEFCPTAKFGRKERKYRNEVVIFSRKAGKWRKIAKLRRIGIFEDVPAQIEIMLESRGPRLAIMVWVNGQYAGEGVTNSATHQDGDGRFGFYARGRTAARFDYFYAYNRTRYFKINNQFFNRVRGDWRLHSARADWIWNIGKKRIKKRGQRKIVNRRIAKEYFDEFGPHVHEVREYDVEFDPAPVRHSELYVSNDWAAKCIEYNSTPTGAKFVMANIAREPAVLSGEDKTIRPGYSGGDAPEQQMLIWGRTINTHEEEEITVRNEASIRANGKSEVSLEGELIQSEAMAQDIADWIEQYWRGGVDILELEIFGNPLLHIGDLVGVDYPAKDMTPETHKYFVVGTSTEFKDGMTTNITLKRSRPIT